MGGCVVDGHNGVVSIDPASHHASDAASEDGICRQTQPCYAAETLAHL